MKYTQHYSQANNINAYIYNIIIKKIHYDVFIYENK